MKTVLHWCVILISFALVVQFSYSFIDLIQKGSVKNAARSRLEKVQTENEQLKQKLAEVEDPGYVEKQARNKLNMAKEGEIVAIVPQVLPEIVDNHNASDTPTMANWKLWLAVFGFL